MKKNVFLLLVACLLGMGYAVAANRLTVSDVSVAPGGQATIEIGCEFDTQFMVFEMQLSLPNGLSLLTDDDGIPIVERAFQGSHVISGRLLPSNGHYKFTGYSTDKANLSLPTSGPLLRVTVVADANLAANTSLTATISGCEFTRTSDSESEILADMSFSIKTGAGVMMGDVNGDKSVTPADAIMILYHYFGVTQNGFIEAAANVNGDNTISPADAIEVLYMYFGAGGNTGNNNSRSARQTQADTKEAE